MSTGRAVTSVLFIFSMTSEPSPSPEHALPEAELELELRHAPLPAISSHTGELPDMDMATGGFVVERKKRVCGKCADCLACKKQAGQTGE